MSSIFFKEWFRGARDVLSHVDQKHYNRNPHPKPNKIVRNILRERLRMDLEFYEFVKQRLALQMKKVGMLGK